MPADIATHASIDDPIIEVEQPRLLLRPVARRCTAISIWISRASQVTALIGPSGCGKSTLLRCLNRMNDLIDGVRIAGQHPARRRRTSTTRPWT